jgi:DNA repair exonuclease SbcCD ATPase subunit
MKPLNDKFLWDMIDRLRDNIEELKLLSCDDDCQDNINLMIKLGAEVKELKAENKRNVDKFEMRVETLKNEVEEGRAENKRLIKQVSSNRGNSSSTHTHTKETEIDAEMIDKHGNVKTIKCYTKDM